MNIYHNKANIIKKWWKKHTEIIKLKKIKKYLLQLLDINELQKLSNNCNSIIKKCKGDGAGLSSGILIDMYLSSYLQSKIPEYNDNHNGECDINICNIPLSLKKINGKSIIALDWSKNNNNVERERFICNIIIVNLKTEKWWKNNPNIKNSKIKITYNDVIPSGIYFIDKKYCKYNVILSKNNKTDSVIDNQNLYIILKRALSLNLFIELPIPNKNIEFNILHAFSK